jgi:hypothetical protein
MFLFGICVAQEYISCFPSDLISAFFSLQWMYIIPLGLIVMNAVTAAAKIPEEQGQAGAQRAPTAAARRR